MQLKKSKQGFFAAKNRKYLSKEKYPEQVAEPESLVTVRIFLFGAVSFKKRYLPTAPSLCEIHNLLENVLKKQEKYLNYSVFADFGYFSSGFGKKCTFFSPIMQL